MFTLILGAFAGFLASLIIIKKSKPTSNEQKALYAAGPALGFVIALISVFLIAANAHELGIETQWEKTREELISQIIQPNGKTIVGIDYGVEILFYQLEDNGFMKPIRISSESCVFAENPLAPTQTPKLITARETFGDNYWLFMPGEFHYDLNFQRSQLLAVETSHD